MGHILMDGMPTIESGGHIITPRRSLHNCFKFSLHTLVLWRVMGLESVYGKICGGGINLCVYNFQVFLESPNCLISAILGNNTLLS